MDVAHDEGERLSGRHGYSKTGLENLRRERAIATRRAHPVLFWVRWWATILLVLGPMVGLVGLVFGLPVYDRAHPIAVECRIDRTAVGITGGRYSHSPYVRFETPDCGYLLLTRGITRDDRDDVAASIALGHRYRVTVGAGSYRFRAALSVLKIRPEVQRYERID